MMVFSARLCRSGVLRSPDPSALTRFAVMTARDVFRRNHARSMPQAQKALVEGDAAVLASLAHCLNLLLCHGVRPFHSSLTHYVYGDGGGEDNRGNKGSKARRELLASRDLRDVLGMAGVMIADPLFAGHPKLDRLTGILLDHFSKHEDCRNEAAGGEPDPQTRVMVFSQYRESVEDIVSVLKRSQPMIRPMQFLGQASGRSGKGLTQKEQVDIINSFQTGNHNVLVSTSIGEEGLDIGEVDLIVCYDSQSSPIRMVRKEVLKKKTPSIFVS
ncbi:MAG: P-loop containing nucleoside triphosphate hydrolase protein [Olpidium bornovanus]|uniref:ATP-dependent DNA helicase n=1 Tax=Olpidium bornovanus TaxID=278681 RepID=A0A8H8A0F8_9FUNG|nr:MAG: P-loop containing nucleoside triphosphate hydrolase protein [Olpidium bornovanus]